MDLLQLTLAIWLWALSLFIVIYFGYILLVFALAKWKARPVLKSDSFTPPISIIIPCYNVERTVARKIEETLEIIYPRSKYEIIAVESGSNDNTYGELSKYRSHEQITLVRQPERLGKVSAINAGLEKSRNDIVVLTDADARLDNDSIKEQ